MIKLYITIFVLGLVGSVAAGGYFYYKDTQERIATLQANNAQLEVAVQTAQESVDTLQKDMAKMSDLNNTLQKDLQKAEAYSDELKSKLSRLNLVVEALKDSKVLEGKMNGATAKLWRGFMSDTGNINEYDLPSWLQQPSGDENQDGNEDRKDSSTSSSETQTTSTK
jgi:type II secretory pathway pseudopilin PulG